jgi:hypothetical protein
MNKPFNLKKALAGEPIVTRDGRNVKEFELRFHEPHDAPKCYPYQAVIEQDGGLKVFNVVGRYYDDDTMQSENDLFML